MIVEAVALGKPQIKSDQTLTFDFFLEVSKIITKYHTRFVANALAEKAKARRALCKTEDVAQWSKIVSEHVNWEQLVNARIQEILYEAVGVKSAVHEKTNKTYMMEP